MKADLNPHRIARKPSLTSPAGSRVAQRSNHGEGAGEPGMFGDYDLDHRQNNLVIDLCMMRDPAFSDWDDHSGPKFTGCSAGLGDTPAGPPGGSYRDYRSLDR